MLTEDRVIQNNLLEKFNQLIGQISSHEGFDSNGHLFGVLGLREGGLHHLKGRRGRRDKDRNVDRKVVLAIQTVIHEKARMDL